MEVKGEKCGHVNEDPLKPVLDDDTTSSCSFYSCGGSEDHDENQTDLNNIIDEETNSSSSYDSEGIRVCDSIKT